jgi:hypothetical protein
MQLLRSQELGMERTSGVGVLHKKKDKKWKPNFAN